MDPIEKRYLADLFRGGKNIFSIHTRAAVMDDISTRVFQQPSL